MPILSVGCSSALVEAAVAEAEGASDDAVSSGLKVEGGRCAGRGPDRIHGALSSDDLAEREEHLYPDNHVTTPAYGPVRAIHL